MISEDFASGGSSIHRIDPRLRVVIAVSYAIMVAISARFETLFFALAAALCMVIAARLPLIRVFRRLLLVNGMILFLWLVLPLTVGGPAAVVFDSLAVSREGILLAARITLKSNAILLSGIALLATQSIGTLGHALNRLKVPDKLVYLMLITFRYIFVLEQEYRRLARAMRVRGFSPGTNVHTYRTYAYLIGMLFVRAADRAERVRRAMICRGFSGKFYSLQEFSLSGRDWFWAGGLGGSLLVLGSIEWAGIL